MRPNDFGPIYTETDLSRFPVEPWNTYSNIGFLIILIYWSWKTRLNFKISPIIVGSLPLLLIGFIGGTIFHATRSHRVWLIMDFTPIFLIAIAISLHLWRRITGKLLYASLLVAISVTGIPAFLRFLALDKPLRIAMGYLGLALTVIIPAGWLAHRSKFLAIPLLSSFLFLMIALTFRQLDKLALLPMGTHFLWHIFGSLGVHLIFLFLLREEIAFKNQRGNTTL